MDEEVMPQRDRQMQIICYYLFFVVSLATIYLAPV
jgi:hypothetical protein